MDEEDFRRSARVSAGLDRLAEDVDLDALAYFRGTNGSVYERLVAGLILGNSLLTARGIPASGEGDLKMLATEGESLPGPTLKIGNTNSRLRFTLPPAVFMNAWCEQGPTHHCAIGVGPTPARCARSRAC